MSENSSQNGNDLANFDPPGSPAYTSNEQAAFQASKQRDGAHQNGHSTHQGMLQVIQENPGEEAGSENYQKQQPIYSDPPQVKQNEGLQEQEGIEKRKIDSHANEYSQESNSSALRTRLKMLNQLKQQHLPHPPQNPYNLFCARIRKQENKKEPKPTAAMIKQTIKEKWAATKADKDKHTKWLDKAEKDKQRHEKEWEAFYADSSINILKHDKGFEDFRTYKKRLASESEQIEKELKQLEQQKSILTPDELQALKNLEIYVNHRLCDAMVKRYAKKLTKLNIVKVLILHEKRISRLEAGMQRVYQHLWNQDFK